MSMSMSSASEFIPPPARRLIGLAMIMAVVSNGCSPDETAPESQPRIMPNVILITLDTLRADHLGCYGYVRPTSPRIDAFAETATLYRRGYATSPWTVPTHGSLFTGKFPYEHGAHTFKVDRPVNNVNRLPLEHLTLAEVLKQEGYETGAFIANDGYLVPASQFNQGFDTYHVERVYADILNQRVFDWLEPRKGKPFFLFINHIDTHRPYNTTPRLGITDLPVVRDQGQLLDRLGAAVLPGTGPIPADLVARVTDQYDTAVANVDAAVGSMLDRLQAMGIYDKTVIVLTSDHGEFIGEHHLVEHSKDVYQEVLWVPLIVKNVGQSLGSVFDAITTSNDVPRLIFSQCPPAIAQRYDKAFPDAPGDHPVISENYYTRTKDLFDKRWGHRFNRIRTVIYQDDFKYIHSSDGKHELYNLKDDPTESNDLATSRPELAGSLASSIATLWMNRPPWASRPEPARLSNDQIRNLKSLGYAGDEE